MLPARSSDARRRSSRSAGQSVLARRSVALVAVAAVGGGAGPFGGAAAAEVGGRGADVAAAVVVALEPTSAEPTRSRRHEVPADVAVQIYIRPDADTLRLLVRVPLEAMRDMDWPVRGPGYLDLTAAAPLLREAASLWIADYLTLYEDGRPLGSEQIGAVRLSLPSDRSFGSYEQALAHLRAGTLDPSTDIVSEQALLDVELTVPIVSDEARFSIDPSLAHLGVATVSVLHFLPAGGGERVFQYDGDPGVVRLDPRWHQAVLRFVRMGFIHILEGMDHLLFILCLVIPLQSVRALVPVVTAFTVAHSLTLLAAAVGFVPGGLWFPPLIETLIALSIVLMALENILRARPGRRWIVAFIFGLVHGFGFSFALSRSLQFAGGHLITSLLAFNVGVELGQLAVIAVVAVLLRWGLARLPSPRAGVVVLSALVAHTAWHWMTARGATLMEYRPAWPVLDGLFVAGLMRAAMLTLVAVGAAWGLSVLYGRLGWTSRGEGLDPHVT